MEPLNSFALKQFPSSTFEDSIKRKIKFLEFLSSIFPLELPVKYNFIDVRGDGSCFFHSILRYFGYLSWLDLPNKDSNQFDEEEQLAYAIVLSNMRESATEYIRDFIGLADFVLDSNVPEYQLICKFIADTMNLRIIVIEYDAYKSVELNKVYQFESESGDYSDSAILINMSNHFTLVFPTSTNPKYDTRAIRKIVVDDLVSKAFLSEKLA